MKFGYVTPQNWGVEDPQDVIDLAVKAEELGYDSVWVNHHILNVGYIYDRLGDRPYYDALTVLAWVAALTERVRLGTTVLVLPYLNPLVLAKTVATLDVMSGGRVTLGVGVGMLREENDALGSDFTTRGAYADESIEIMRELWTADEPEYSGRFFDFGGNFRFSPKPAQNPLPILVGGMSRAAMRRSARLGDGWHPNAGSISEFAARVQTLTEIWRDHNRNPDDMQLVVRCEVDILDSPSDNADTPMIGTPDQLARAVSEYQSLGVSEIVLGISDNDLDRIRRIQESFAEKVMPLVSG